MEIREIPIKDLRPVAYNPRRISDVQFGKLRQSIREFGIVEPAVVNMFKGRENNLVGGHMRIRAAEAEGKATYPCFIVMLDEAKEKLLNIALNKISGQWDDLKLGELIVGLSREGADVRLTGFEDDELVKISEEHNIRVNPDDEGAKKKEKVGTGESWALGDHRIFCLVPGSIKDIETALAGKGIRSVFAHANMAAESVCHLLLSAKGENGVILDLVGSGGAVLMAAHKMGLTCYAIEPDRGRVDALITRWESETGLKAKKLKDS